MTQYIGQIAPDPQAQLEREIAGSLGSGLSNFMTYRNANQSLEKAMNDPEFKNLSQAEKMDRLVQATQGFGEQGENMLAKRLGIEKQYEDQKQASSLAKMLGIPEELGLDKNTLMEIYKQRNAREIAEAKQRDYIQEAAQKQMRAEASKIAEKGDDYRPILSNLNDMKRLSRDFRGPQSSVTGRIPYTTAYNSAAEFEGLADTTLKPILDLYNPRGPIPQQKIVMLRKALRPNWNDTQPVIDAKIDAIERLTLHKVKRADRARQALMDPTGRIDPKLLYDDAEENIIDQVYEDMRKKGIIPEEESLQMSTTETTADGQTETTQLRAILFE